jgi:hypothetical protein
MPDKYAMILDLKSRKTKLTEKNCTLCFLIIRPSLRPLHLVLGAWVNWEACGKDHFK